MIRLTPLSVLLLTGLLGGLLPRAAADQDSTAAPPTTAAPGASRPSTFCNPIDIGYRFSLKGSPHREAADPTLVWYKNEFWLFASKSGGYWHSKDMGEWTFIAATGLPWENYAPAVEVINGKMYFTASGVPTFYTTDDPAKGQWTALPRSSGGGDPDIFADDDGKDYFYAGCSSKAPISGWELDPSADFIQKGDKVGFFKGDPLHHGWEIKDLLATDAQIQTDPKMLPYLEGSWMTKHNGTYYLQYAAPGTERDWYGDGVYTSQQPLGPFHYALYSPFALKVAGFVTGTGHGSTCMDGQGHYWHADCLLIRGFERRVGIFPAGFVPAGSGPDQLVCSTYLGDYPQYVAGVSPNPLKNNSPGWMLLSYKKPAKASTTMPSHPIEDAFDESIKTWWSAQTGNAGEWLSVDLGKACQIQAMQMNFADQGARTVGRLENDAYKYTVEVSSDEKSWTMCIDKTNNTRDAPHDYVQLPQPVIARYVRITNVHCPAPMKFSLRGFRIFGSGQGNPPTLVTGLTAQRQENRRLASLNWTSVPNADFYIVRYGIAADRLYSNQQVYGVSSLTLAGLNTEADYFVTVDAVNDSGVTMGTQVAPIK